MCADIGSDTQIYEDNGYNVIRIGKDIGVENYSPDCPIHGVVANPVCTEFSIARGYHKHGDETKGMFLVNHCIRIIRECNPVFWVIENPATGRLKNHLGTPDFVYHPWQFGDPWTKKTALWGVFNAPEPLYEKWEDVPKNEHLYIRPGRSKPCLACLHKSAINHIPNLMRFKDKVQDNMSFRSLCSQGFAQAFYNINQ